MDTKDYLRILRNEIHSTVMATVDEEGHPVTRGSFTIGSAAQEKEHGGYFITDKCIGCQACYGACPQKCIDTSDVPLVIRQEHCLHCGNCFRACPVGAVVKR
jgi:NAD-dependent dihydropyrimidine dehydrogenase PreA subunit